MNLIVCSLKRAQEYQPEQPTYVIRIYDPYSRNGSHTPLMSSPLYKEIHEYTFEDIDFLRTPERWEEPGERERVEREIVIFTPAMAEQILIDFQNRNPECLDLLVHCTLGASRSPAVAFALNDLFGLENDSKILQEKYNGGNLFVYNTLMTVGTRMIR